MAPFSQIPKNFQINFLNQNLSFLFATFNCIDIDFGVDLLLRWISRVSISHPLYLHRQGQCLVSRHQLDFHRKAATTAADRMRAGTRKTTSQRANCGEVKIRLAPSHKNPISPVATWFLFYLISCLIGVFTFFPASDWASSRFFRALV